MKPKKAASCCAALLFAALLWAGHREYQIRTTPPRPIVTAEQETAAQKAFADSYMLYKATPNPATEKAMLKAGNLLSDIHYRRIVDQPDSGRTRTRLKQAMRDLLSGNVLRCARGLRHTLIPALDRPDLS
jgi:hypothetical protein